MMYRDITPDEIWEFWVSDGFSALSWISVWTCGSGGCEAAHMMLSSRGIPRSQSWAAEGDLWFRLGENCTRPPCADYPPRPVFQISVWAGTPKAFAQDPRALGLRLKASDNGHFDVL